MSIDIKITCHGVAVLRVVMRPSRSVSTHLQNVPRSQRHRAWQIDLTTVARDCTSYNARMATLRRILKYTPAVVLGLLIVAWVTSQFWWLKWQFGRATGSSIEPELTLSKGKLEYWSINSAAPPKPTGLTWGGTYTPMSLTERLGELKVKSHTATVPIVLLITFVAPLPACDIVPAITRAPPSAAPLGSHQST